MAQSPSNSGAKKKASKLDGVSEKYENESAADVAADSDELANSDNEAMSDDDDSVCMQRMESDVSLPRGKFS